MASKGNGARKGVRHLKWAAALNALDDNAALLLIVLRIALFVIILLALRGLLRLYFFGGTFLGKEVPSAKIERIEVKAGDAVPAAILLDHLRINEGMPMLDPEQGLFAGDLGKRQEKILRAAPALASLSITRGPSNVVHVLSTERVPLARIGSTFDYMIDRDGVVFVRHRRIDGLPVITGTNMALRPGDRLTTHRMLLSALELLRCLEEGGSELRKGFIASLDVSKPDYVQCEFIDGRVAKFAWRHMGRGERGRPWLVAQLNGYVATIQSPRSKGCKYFDLTIPGHCYASQSR